MIISGIRWLNRGIEDCKLNICGCRSPRRRRCNPYEPEASLPHYYRERISLRAVCLNIQSLEDRENAPI
jgi:hypothetical protein